MEVDKWKILKRVVLGFDTEERVNMGLGEMNFILGVDFLWRVLVRERKVLSFDAVNIGLSESRFRTVGIGVSLGGRGGN